MKRLKELRLNKNLTQQQLGKLLSVSGQTILNWENDITYPSVKKLIELASFFDVSIDYLLDFKEKDTNFDKIINILNDYEKEDLIKLIDAIKERNQLINDIVKEIDGDGIRLSREIDSKISYYISLQDLKKVFKIGETRCTKNQV